MVRPLRWAFPISVYFESLCLPLPPWMWEDYCDFLAACYRGLWNRTLSDLGI